MIEQIRQYFSRKSAGVSSPMGTGGLRSTVLQSGSFLYNVLAYGSGIGSGIGIGQAMEMYRESGAVATAVDIIAQEIEQIQPVIRLKDGLLDDSHDVLTKLYDPNEYNESYQDLIGDIARNWLLTRNAFLYAGGTVTRPPLEIFSVKPQVVSVYEDSLNQFPLSYQVADGVGRGSYSKTRTPRAGYRYYDGNMREIWQMRGYSSGRCNLFADSPLKSVCLDVYQQVRGRIHNVQMLTNGARPSMVVTFKDESISQDEFDARAQSLREQLAGADNAGKIAIVGADDTSLESFGQTNKDMDYLNLDNVSSRAVYNRYHIPLPLVTSDASTFSNMESAVAHLYDFAVLPNLSKIFSSISMFLLPRYGVNPSEMQITYNPEAIPALKARRLAELKTRKDIGLESINEMREYLPNREPVPGGDSIYIPANLVPVGQDAFTADNATTTAEQRAQELIDRDAEV